MPSTYTTQARLEDIANGEKSGSWGDITDTNIGLIEEFISGLASVTHDDTANYSLTTANAATDESRPMMCEIGGALTAQRNVVCPTLTKLFFVKNATTGGFDIVFKTTAGTGITIPNGETMIVYCDGTNVVDAITNLPAGTTIAGVTLVDLSSSQTLTNKTINTLTVDLAIADGGTGASNAADALDNLGIDGASGNIVEGDIGALAVTTGKIAANAVDGTKIAIGSDAIGDILYYNGTDYVILAAGTLDQVLKAQGAAAPIWEGPDETIIIPVSDETTAITTGTAKVTFRMPYAMTLNANSAGVKASLSTASSSGLPTVDINEGGTTILSTKLTIDANEKTSTTAATEVVTSDVDLADDAEITIDIDVAGTGATGLKVYLMGVRA
jgi:hypothetical protein